MLDHAEDAINGADAEQLAGFVSQVSRRISQSVETWPYIVSFLMFFMPRAP